MGSAAHEALPVIRNLDIAVFAYFLLANGFYFVLLVSSCWELRRHLFEIAGETRHELLSSPLAPRISILVPALDEAATIEQSVSALLTLSYPNLEVVVVDDGSSDGTLDVLIQRLQLTRIHPVFQRRLELAPVLAVYRSRAFPNLIVIAKANGGKADSLNAGLCIATGELVCAQDADTIIEPDALQRLVRPFLEADETVAAGATIRVVNGCSIKEGRVCRTRAPRSFYAGVQTVEYVRAFLFGRLGWNRLGGNLVISGAFGLFRREAVLAAGGYLHGVGEDMEIIVRLRRRGYEQGEPQRVAFVPDPVAWTEVPESRRVLGRQRDRWHRGLSDTLWRHRSLLFRPRYGALGMVVFPVFVLVEWLAPIVEAVGLLGLAVGLGLGAVDADFAVLFFVAAYGLGLLASVTALLLDELAFPRYRRISDWLWLLLWAFIENLGYRQLTVYWRLRGIVGFLRGRTEWGAMERRGFATETSDIESVTSHPTA